ncbi:hypothetical protein ACIA5A_17005 [Micromonospora sp. NPDC051300]|uniref:hypothetical protein n=1 Tax=Micromonospora sp. NPDC051300 TaxID=3364286 RepID=UPI0037BD3B4C
MDGTGERQEIRRGRRRFRLLLAGTIGAFTLVSILVGWLAEGFPASWLERGNPPGWLEVTGRILAVSGLVLMIVTLIRMVRGGGYRADQKSPLWAVSARRRRALARGVRRDMVASPDDLPWLRATAAQMVRQRWVVASTGGLLTMNLGQALLSLAPIWLALMGIMAVMFGIVCWQVPRDARRAEAFLRHHPAEPPAAPATA